MVVEQHFCRLTFEEHGVQTYWICSLLKKICNWGCRSFSLRMKNENMYRVSQKSVNKEISITFKQMDTQRCVRSQIGGSFGCWALLNNCQECRMCPSCVYMCLNICNPFTIFIISKVMLISLFTLFFGTPCMIMENNLSQLVLQFVWTTIYWKIFYSTR